MQSEAAGSTHLPLPGARELLDPPDNQVALDSSQPIHEEAAVQMIHFMLKRPREKSFPLDLVLSSVAVQPLHHGPCRAHDGGIESRQTQTAFLFELHTIPFDEDRIDEGEQACGIATDRQIDHEDP